jgi:polysaccharide export outer membrane protein
MTRRRKANPCAAYGLALLLGLLSGCQSGGDPFQAVAPERPAGAGHIAAYRPDGYPAEIVPVAYPYASRFGPAQDLAPPPRLLPLADHPPEPRRDPAPVEPRLPPPGPVIPAPPPPEPAPPGPTPTELARVVPPCYIIEPPDVLLLDTIRLVPRPPYRVEPLDILLIQVTGTAPDKPITGQFQVSPEGTISLGFDYGVVRVVGLTVEQAANAIKLALTRLLANPQVVVALAQFRGVQQVRGEHLVNQDGTITLGSYGCVNVVGLSLKQAKFAIEKHLSQFLLNPEISVSVSAYNSKYYYLIFDGGGYGQQVIRLPITGSDTVLDAISLVGGLPPVASKKKIWVARPTPAHACCFQILPVAWQAITEGGQTDTNWQLFPGDRIYVRADPLIELDLQLQKIFSPIERIFGITLLGSATVQSFRNNNGNGNNNGGFLVGF